MPLKDLVVYLGNKRATGVLALEYGEQRKKIVIREGLVISASSNEPREYLGQFLINLGHITEEQFNKAYETQKETRIFLGKILVMIGAVSEETVKNALSMKVRETLLQAFNWTEGEFEFSPDAPQEVLEGMELNVDLLDVHREGEFRETAWQAIRAAFPSGDLKLRLNESKLPEQPRAGSLDERLFKFIREGNTIDEMVLALHATDFFLYQRLYALYRLEAVSVAPDEEESSELEVEVDEPLAPEVSLIGEELGGEASVAEIIDAAETFAAQDNFVEAEALARRAHELAPTRQTEALLRTVESGLLRNLRRTMIEARPVASLTVPPARLRAMQLSAPERYLLSRVDGTRDVPSIIQVSPLQELEALKLFQRFVDTGLVKLS